MDSTSILLLVSILMMVCTLAAVCRLKANLDRLIVECSSRSPVKPVIEELSYRPGDVLVLTLPGHLTAKSYERLLTQVSEALRDVGKVMVLEDGMSLTIVHGANMAPGVAPADAEDSARPSQAALVTPSPPHPLIP